MRTLAHSGVEGYTAGAKRAKRAKRFYNKKSVGSYNLYFPEEDAALVKIF